MAGKHLFEDDEVCTCGVTMSEKDPDSVAVANRMDIPLFTPGPGRPSAFSAGDMNLLVRTLRALVNPQIVWGSRDEVRIADGNFTIALSRSQASGGGLASIYRL